MLNVLYIYIIINIIIIIIIIDYSQFMHRTFCTCSTTQLPLTLMLKNLNVFGQFVAPCYNRLFPA